MKQALSSARRAALLARLAQAGRANSDATVFFHATLARLLELNPTDYKAMSVLERLGPMSAGQIAEHTGLAAASVTNLIDRLQQKGLVRRMDDPADRRRVLVAPLAEQVDAARKHFRSMQRALARLYERYSERELEVIADFLERSAKTLHDMTAKLSQADGARASQSRDQDAS